MARLERSEPTTMERALWVLSYKERSRAELRRKLAEKGCAPAEIDAALARLEELGYVSDERLARARASSQAASGRYGPLATARKLAAAGVSRGLIRAAVQEAWSGRDELAAAVAALRRKHPAASGTRDPRLKARACRFLVARGFSLSVVRRAIAGESRGE